MRPASLCILALVFLTFLHPVAAASNCNDLDIDPSSVTLKEDQDGRNLILRLENNSNEDFEIDDVRVQESSPHFDISVDDFPDKVEEDETEDIRLEYDTPDLSGDEEDTFTVSIRGEFDDEEDCDFSDLQFTIHATVEDGDNACFEMEVRAENVVVQESETLVHTIEIENPTDEDFVIQGFNVFDDSGSFSAKLDTPFNDTDFVKIIPAHTTNQYDIEIDAQNVSGDETDSVFIEVRGEFENGLDCSLSDIEGEFDVTVEDTGVNSGVCSSISINAPTAFVYAGQTTSHSMTLLNKASHAFYVDEYTITDKNYQVEFETMGIDFGVDALENQELSYTATGYPNTGSFDSNAFVNIKGHFTNGGSCFISAKKIPFHFTGSTGTTCESFHVGISPITVLHGTQKVDVLFQNPLNQSATITLASTAGEVTPRTLTLGSNTNKIFTLNVPESTENQTLTIQSSVPGCTLQSVQSTILFSSVQDAPVQIKDASAILRVPMSAKQFAIQLENQSAFTQDATITFITKPGSNVFTYTTSIGGFDEPLIYLPASLLQGKTLAILQVKSAGYTVAHTYQVERTQDTPAAPVPTVTQNPVQVVIGGITGFVSGTSGIWTGLLVILLLVGLWYVAKPKLLLDNEEKDPVFVTKDANTASLNDDEWTEPWNVRKE